MVKEKTKTKAEQELEFIKNKLEFCVSLMKEKRADNDKWLYFHLIPAIKGLREYHRLKKDYKEAKVMTKYIRAFKMIQKKEVYDHVFLSLFLNDETKIEDNGLGHEITEKYPNKDDKDGFRILDQLNGITSINFRGLSIEVPTKIVKYLEEIKK